MPPGTFLLFFAIAGAFALCAGPAAAAPADRDLTACLNHKTALESRLAACTRVIKGRAPAQSRAFAYAARGGLIAIHKRDFASAIADLDQAVRLQPSLATFVQLRGSVQMEARQYDAAIANFDSALRLDPRLSSVHRFRGLAHLRNGNYPQAITDLNVALKADAKPEAQAEILALRAEAYVNAGDRERSLQDFTRSIELDAKVDRRYAERAALYFDQGELDQAMRDLDRVIPEIPGDAASRARRGKILRLRGEHERALHDLDEAIRINPTVSAAYQDRGLIYGERGDHAQAIRDLDEAIRLEPKDVLAYINRGDQHWKLGEFDRAIRDFDEALKIDPGKALTWTNRGIAFQSKGENERALADFRKALSVAQSGAEDAWASATARDRIAALTASPSAPVAAAPAQTVPAASAASIAPAAPLAVSTERRVALVIGNTAYKAVAVLPNPARDAAAIAATLRGIGFATVRLEGDLSREKLTDALRNFSREAAGADWAIIYFAGHGLEINGTNYLVPVDAKLETDRDVQYEALPLDQVTAAVEGARKLRLVILDACRDNPFVRGMRRTAATRSVGRGLARVEPEGGTLVAYAAKNGEVALDGDGANSPFVSALLTHLPTPGLEIGMMFRHVRDDVMASTGRKQEPFVYGSLPAGGFYFVEK